MRAAIAAVALGLAAIGPAMGEGVSPALAPILSIEFGYDMMVVAPGQIVSVTVDTRALVPVVVVTLVDGLQFELASLTLVHVGQVAKIKVCGLVVSEPTLTSAIKTPSFIIANGDAAETRRLAAILQAQDCDAQPVS
jgi:hypothetical protein